MLFVGKKPIGGRGLGFRDKHAKEDEGSASDMIRSVKEAAAAVVDNASTPPFDRQAAMRSVFQAKFRSQFTAASSVETGAMPVTTTSMNVQKSGESSDDRKRRKTRWE